MKNNYIELFKDPRWQKLRLEVFQRDNFECKYCGSKVNTLNVHHLIYKKGKKPWEYELKDLITLCQFCHEEESLNREDCEQILLQILKQKGFSWNDLLFITDGFISLSLSKPPEVMASLIKFIFTNKELSQSLENKYFESLNNLGDKK